MYRSFFRNVFIAVRKKRKKTSISVVERNMVIEKQVRASRHSQTLPSVQTPKLKKKCFSEHVEHSMKRRSCREQLLKGY